MWVRWGSGGGIYSSVLLFLPRLGEGWVGGWGRRITEKLAKWIELVLAY